MIAGLVVALGLSAGVAHAAWISEVSFEPRFARDGGVGGATLPRYIEVSGLPAASLQLVVINANTPVSQYGDVLQVITLPVGQPVQVVAETAWPAGVLPGNPATGVVTTLGSGATFSFTATDKRSLLLYDGVTGFVTGTRFQLQTLNPGVQLIDILTWGAGAKKFNASDTVHDFSAYSPAVAAKPNATLGIPASFFLAGSPNVDQYFANISPVFQLNPGQFNLVWAAPEPATGALALTLIPLALRRRRRPMKTHLGQRASGT